LTFFCYLWNNLKTLVSFTPTGKCPCFDIQPMSDVNNKFISTTKRQSKEVQKYCKSRFEELQNRLTILPTVLHHMIIEYASPIEYVVLIHNQEGLLQMQATSSLLPTTDKWLHRSFHLPKWTLSINKIQSLANMMVPYDNNTKHRHHVNRGEGFILNQTEIVKNPWCIFNHKHSETVAMTKHALVTKKVEKRIKMIKRLDDFSANFIGVVRGENKESCLYYEEKGDYVTNLQCNDNKHPGLSIIYNTPFLQVPQRIKSFTITQYNNVNYIFGLSALGVIVYSARTNSTDLIGIANYDPLNNINSEYVPTIHGILCIENNLTGNLRGFTMIDPNAKTSKPVVMDPWCIFPFNMIDQHIMVVTTTSISNNTIIVLYVELSDNNNIPRSFHIIWMDLLESPGVWRNCTSVPETTSIPYITHLFDVLLDN
jgi:hypothetical protein